MKRHKLVQLKQDIEVQVISYGQIREERGRFEAGQRCELLDKLHGAVCLRVGCHVFWTNLHFIEEVAVKRPPAPTKAEKRAADPVLGAVYVCSWGYDQTNVDAYQVVRATEKSLWLQAINTIGVDGTEGAMCQRVKPVRNSFVRGAKVFRVRRQGEIPTRACGSLWDGKRDYYCSWYA